MSNQTIDAQGNVIDNTTQPTSDLPLQNDPVMLPVEIGAPNDDDLVNNTIQVETQGTNPSFDYESDPAFDNDPNPDM
jgi:hypothetical protein